MDFAVWGSACLGNIKFKNPVFISLYICFIQRCPLLLNWTVRRMTLTWRFEQFRSWWSCWMTRTRWWSARPSPWSTSCPRRKQVVMRWWTHHRWWRRSCEPCQVVPWTPTLLAVEPVLCTTSPTIARVCWRYSSPAASRRSSKCLGSPVCFLYNSCVNCS